MIQQNISSPSRWRKYFFLVTLAAIASLQACKEPDTVGLDVLPSSDELTLQFSDTSTIYSRTVTEDSLRTDEISAQLLGSISDPVFGKHQASIYSQVVLEGTPSFGTITQADSLIVSMLYSGSYGDTNISQTYNVYRLTEDIYYDSSYYSTRTIAYDPAPIGSLTTAPRPSTPIVVGGDTVVAQLRIPLDLSLADSIMALNGQSVLSNNDLWRDYFKGIYIQAAEVSSGNKGNICYLNFAGSKMILYYHDTTNTVKTYSFSLASTRFTSFSHDYSGTDAGMQLADSSALDSLAFIQAMSGVKTKISLPFVKHFLDSGSIVINRAELELPVEANSTTDYPAPSQLLILAINENGESEFPADYFEVSGYYGGTYNSDKNKYTFNIARQLQRILDGRSGNYGFYIVPSGSSIQGNRVILGSQKKADKNSQMKLNLYYTKLPR